MLAERGLRRCEESQQEEERLDWPQRSQPRCRALSRHNGVKPFHSISDHRLVLPPAHPCSPHAAIAEA